MSASYGTENVATATSLVNPVDGLGEHARAWLDPALEFAMETGLDRMTLRPLAAHLGTSDRMLVYHFGSKERLVEAVAWHASERLATALGEPVRRFASTEEAVRLLWGVLSSPASVPYLRLYFELLVLALREPERVRPAAARVAERWEALVTNWLLAAGRDLPPWAGAYVLAALEGLLVLRASGAKDIDEAAILSVVVAPLE